MAEIGTFTNGKLKKCTSEDHYNYTLFRVHRALAEHSEQKKVSDPQQIKCIQNTKKKKVSLPSFRSIVLVRDTATHPFRPFHEDGFRNFFVEMEFNIFCSANEGRYFRKKGLHPTKSMLIATKTFCTFSLCILNTRLVCGRSSTSFRSVRRSSAPNYRRMLSERSMDADNYMIFTRACFKFSVQNRISAIYRAVLKLF